MSLLRIACRNLLEEASTLTDVGTPTAGYPITRLVDRNTAREYRITEDVAREWQATGGISARLANALMIAAGHNSGGLAYTLSSSADGASWAVVSTGTIPAGTGVALVEFAEAAAAYWKFELPANADITMTELLLTHVYTFERQAARPSGALENEYNVKAEETSAGSERFIEYGPVRRVRNYSFPNVPSAMVDELAARIGPLGMKKPFFLCDHAGVWIWGNLTAPLAPREIAAGRFSLDFNFREVLG